MTIIDIENYQKHQISEDDAIDLRYQLEEDTFNLLDQNSVYRWTGRHMIHRQSIAEHHAYVTQYLIAIFDMFDVPEDDQLKAMKRAVTHDLPETELCDIPYPVHVKYSHLSEAYDQAEQDVWNGKYSIYKSDVKKGSSAWMLVKLADRLDRINYLYDEQQMGNASGYVADAIKEERDKCEELIMEIGECYQLKY